MNLFSMNLSNLLFYILIGYALLNLLFLAIDSGVKWFLDIFAFEKTTYVKVTNAVSFILFGILLFVYLSTAYWILLTFIDKNLNIQDVGLVLGGMFLFLFFSSLKFKILSNRRN